MGVELCSECGSLLAASQHYCLNCGARAGARSPQLLALLRRISEQPLPAELVGTEPDSNQGDQGLRAHPLRVPSRRVSALLVLGFLGFGVLLGGAAGSRVSDTLAASVAPLKLVLAAQSAASPESSSSSSSEPEPAESEAPPVEEQATPRRPRQAPPRRHPRTRAPRKKNPRKSARPL